MNTAQRHSYKLTVNLAVSGLISGALPPLLGGGLAFLLLGGVFGVAISVCLAALDISRRYWDALRFTIVCCGAFFFSAMATFFVQLALPWDHWSMGHNPSNSPVAFFIGGTLGAFLVLGEALFLLNPETPWSVSLYQGLRWSPVGGVLGAIGCLFGSQPSEAFSPLLFVVWQAGVGAVIGFLFDRQMIAAFKPAAPPAIPKVIAPPTARRLPIAYAMFFLLIVGVLSFYSYRMISIDRAAAKRQRRISAAMATAPSAENVPPIIPVAKEDALLMRDIAGNVPVLPNARSMYPVSSTQPPTYNYSVGYQLQPMANGLDYHPVAQVGVTEYPNSDWAKYSLKDIPVPNSAITDEKYIQKVAKFGNTIIENTAWRYPDGRGDLYYYWASGQYAITVRICAPTSDDLFLQAYLEKYPSSPQ
ncbi:MAG TPA: hypothetical protein VGS15_11180 [Candidatus Acidoferrales bacterium]|nr:hypothetical protein [Candidatus Acidoferrales bacterium]